MLTHQLIKMRNGISKFANANHKIFHDDLSPVAKWDRSLGESLTVSTFAYAFLTFIIISVVCGLIYVINTTTGSQILQRRFIL